MSKRIVVWLAQNWTPSEKYGELSTARLECGHFTTVSRAEAREPIFCSQCSFEQQYPESELALEKFHERTAPLEWSERHDNSLAP